MWRCGDTLNNLCRDPVTVLAVASVVGVGASIFQGEKAAKEAKAARGEASQRADAELVRQQTEREKLKKTQQGRTRRDVSLVRSRGTARGQGVSGTRLTGAGGIDASLLNLARNTLLG